MKQEKILFTSESVAEGHPDKVCDQIADAILDACLALDPSSHVACEVFATTEYILIGGEITCKGKVDYEAVARGVLRDIGYTSPELGIGCDTCKIDVKVKEQSPDIAMGVNRGSLLEMGAGDQGFMFGYATNESSGYMPLAISLAHKLVRTATALRKSGEFKGARPDMKSQVTIDYTDPKHIKIDTMLMSIQHNPDVDMAAFKKYVHEQIMIPVALSFGLNADFKVLINPTGRFVLGGPAGDTGLTGRKLIVDTYGGTARHGGGSFSGKDPSKVDRSAAYYARYIAKNLVAAGAADRLEVQLSYAIGVAKPMSIGVATFHTKHYSDEVILEAIDKFFDCRPGAIIEQLSLTKPSWRYRDITNYGPFGRPDIDLPWERLDKVAALKAFFASKK
ncbi:MAG: S-adenosylmethionine synthase [Tenericutes bacterium ADurb.BinA155]|jgi:S-adenosylmethionine synthetase|nr:MAG: S-adenosylmethionine synthase [Tenericutes bacterium ADurb.BinA155]